MLFRSFIRATQWMQDERSLKDNSGILNIEPPFWFIVWRLALKFWLLVLSRVFGSFRIVLACLRIAGDGTRQKLYFATILDLERQKTPLTTRWVAHFWRLMFRVVLRTGLFMLVASHSEAGRGDSKWAKYPRQDQSSKCRCQPLCFILDKPERGLNGQNTGIVL